MEMGLRRWVVLIVKKSDFHGYRNVKNMWNICKNNVMAVLAVWWCFQYVMLNVSVSIAERLCVHNLYI